MNKEKEYDLSDLWIDLGKIVKKYEEKGWLLKDIKGGMENLWDGIELEE